MRDQLTQCGAEVHHWAVVGDVETGGGAQVAAADDGGAVL